MNRLGVQLYSARSLLTNEDQIRDTLQKIRAIGYDSVQLYGSLEQAQMCAFYANAAGLAVTSVHSDLDTYANNLDAYIALCHQYGAEEMGVSNMRNFPEEIPAYIDAVNTLAAQLHKEGIAFSYHNHATEFIKTPSGKTVMQHYMEGFDPNTVYFMPDTFWLQFGGIDIRYFLECTANRVRTIHLKDLLYTRKGADFAEIGNGNLYFDGILSLSQQLGIRHYIVEQDVCPGDPLQSLQQSYHYIRSLNRI